SDSILRSIHYRCIRTMKIESDPNFLILRGPWLFFPHLVETAVTEPQVARDQRRDRRRRERDVVNLRRSSPLMTTPAHRRFRWCLYSASRLSKKTHRSPG